MHILFVMYNAYGLTYNIHNINIQINLEYIEHNVYGIFNEGYQGHLITHAKHVVCFSNASYYQKETSNNKEYLPHARNIKKQGIKMALPLLWGRQDKLERNHIRETLWSWKVIAKIIFITNTLLGYYQTYIKRWKSVQAPMVNNQ